MRKQFIEWLIDKAEKDDSIYLIVPDVGFGIIEPFREKFPDRYINVGIAEQLAVNVAVGLALSGKKPYIYGIATFILYRAFEQIRNYVSHLKLNVKIIGTGKDKTYDKLDFSHWAIDDVAIIENLNICVSCGIDSLESGYIVDTPQYVRLK